MNDRTVHFSVPIHKIHKIEYLDKQWETASRQARDGSCWLRLALDRERFRNRIELASEILFEIFDPDYRQQIYRERFENFAIPELETKATTTKLSVSEETDTTNAGATSTPRKDLSTRQTRPRRKKRHNNKKKRRRKRRGKYYHSKHRGRH